MTLHSLLPRWPGGLIATALLAPLFLTPCHAGNEPPSSPAGGGFSYSRPDEVRLTHLDLTLTVDFKKRQLTGHAEFEVNNLKRVKRLVLDTRDLAIRGVSLGRGDAPTEFDLGREDSILGRPLTIAITPETRYVSIDYATSPSAPALQWLTPSQTAGKKKPFLYTFSEPILARSWIPCQDHPGARLTYRATVKVPQGMLAVMSAINPQSKNSRGTYQFDMPQPIAPYLIALAVGDIDFRSTGRRTGIYAEPPLLAKAARELAATERTIAVAESLYGPYRWGRYDVLFLPPAFPMGGMENPRLTFATPTILAGDRSLVDLITHELAHSWSGNLVTNASWNDIWLNEGVTTYLERRIDEAVWGKEFADMITVRERQELDALVRRIGPTSPETQLYLEQDPHQLLSDDREIVYEKGYLFLSAIEEAAGRRRWDSFLKTYFDKFAFQSITTQQFVSWYKEMLASRDSVLNARIDLQTWLYGQGLPPGIPTPHSARFDKVAMQVRQWQDGESPRPLATKSWSTHEWVYFLSLLPDTMSPAGMSRLDIAFNFSGSSNAEILSAWLALAIKHRYEGASGALERFLTTTGRMKYLIPLYRALADTPEGAERAREIFARAKPLYHSIAVKSIEEILGGS